MPDPVLTVENLGVSFGAETIFENLSFQIERGTMAAIIGPNGAGKTVLFRTLIGAVRHTGAVRWAAGVRIGYVPQQVDLDRNLSLNLRDFLLLRARIAKLPVAAIHEALELVHLPKGKLTRQLNQLSGGELQRALVAFSIMSTPDVLLFDEPTAGIDTPGEEQIYETIHNLQDKKGITVIFISHDLSIVARYAQTVLCLNRSLFCFGNPEETLQSEVLDKLYGAPMLHHLHDHHDA